jgi:uncharacterized iron-regulated membrane protein
MSRSPEARVTQNVSTRKPWPDYQAVWRWHFYAGLFCIPFVLWLAATGSIYLFKPQVEAWLDRPYANLAAVGARVAPSAEVRAALAAEPGAVLHAYQLPRHPGDAAQVLVGQGSGETRVWVDPRSARVLKAVAEDDRFMKVIFRLHGELLLGDRGSMLVELAASWAFVMVITGLYLWWPRQVQGLGGVLYPRLGRGSRLFWRDLHAVTAVWVSATTLLLLASGLPWAKSWGAYLKEIRHLSGQAAVHQDWTTGRSSELAERAAVSAGSLAGRQTPHAEMSGMDMAGMTMGGAKASSAVRPKPALGAYDAIDRMVPTVAALKLAYPVLVTPPMQPGGRWAARSDSQNRPQRVTVTLNPVTGAVLHRQTFGQRDWVDQTVGVGVAAHEGQLFGWPNQLISLLTAMGLFTASLSALVLWWRRRADGVLGAPLPVATPRFSKGLLVIVVGLGVLLPLLGASLIGVLAIERLVLKRIPPVRRWLGLNGPHRPIGRAALPSEAHRG